MLFRKFKIGKDVVMMDNVRIIDWEKLSIVFSDEERERLSARLKGSGVYLDGFLYLDRPESHKHFGFLAFREIWKTMLVGGVNQDIHDLLRVENGVLSGSDLEEGIILIYLEDFSRRIMDKGIGFPEDYICFGVQDFSSGFGGVYSKGGCQEFLKNLVSVYEGEVNEEDVLGVILKAFFTGNTEDLAALLINF